MTIQGRIVMPDPWPEGIRRGFPEGAIFCREPGLQRGRRRAPFARSREEDAQINAALWRTERFQRPRLFPLAQSLTHGEEKKTAVPTANKKVGAHSLTHLTLKQTSEPRRAGKRSAPATTATLTAPSTPLRGYPRAPAGRASGAESAG